MSLTGVRDVDMEIILQLEDRELPAVCAVNKYVNSICQSDAFWYRRLINRISKAREDNLSKYKDLKIIDINGERIKNMRRFFGLKNLKELNSFLNELPQNAAYLAYYTFDKSVNRNFRHTYNFDQIQFPKYINREELIYEMRRQSAKSGYSATSDGSIDNYVFHFDVIPRKEYLDRENLIAYKKMGVIN